MLRCYDHTTVIINYGYIIDVNDPNAQRPHKEIFPGTLVKPMLNDKMFGIVISNTEEVMTVWWSKA